MSLESLCPLASTPQSADVGFIIRNYRAADFDRLWQIDQLCFPPGIAYSQMELSSFVARRNAITLVGELQNANENDDPIAGFVIAHPIRRKYGRILTLDILPQARRSGLATKLMNTSPRSGCAQCTSPSRRRRQPECEMGTRRETSNVVKRPSTSPTKFAIRAAETADAASAGSTTSPIFASTAGMASRATSTVGP